MRESGANNLILDQQICNSCLCGIVEIMMDFKVRGLEFKSRWVPKKTGGLDLGIGLGLEGSMRLGLEIGLG